MGGQQHPQHSSNSALSMMVMMAACCLAILLLFLLVPVVGWPLGIGLFVFGVAWMWFFHTGLMRHDRH